MSGDELKKALAYVPSVAHYFVERPRPEFVPEEAWKYLQRLGFNDFTKLVERLLVAKERLWVDEKDYDILCGRYLRPRRIFVVSQFELLHHDCDIVTV